MVTYLRCIVPTVCALIPIPPRIAVTFFDFLNVNIVLINPTAPYVMWKWKIDMSAFINAYVGVVRRVNPIFTFEKSKKAAHLS